MERGASRYTIRNLLPYRHVHVRLILTNPEGHKEGKEVTFQTDEDGKSASPMDSRGLRAPHTHQGLILFRIKSTV
jgi:receptor-type tyrosine-protein phosphatase U